MYLSLHKRNRMFTGDVQDRGPDLTTTSQPQVSGVTDEWRHRRGQARPTSAAAGGGTAGVRRVQDGAARHRPDPRLRAQDAPVRALLALVRSRIQRRVPHRRNSDHDVRADRQPGHHRHPGRQPVLRVAGFRERAGAEGGHDRVHGEPGTVRPEREPPGGAVQLGHPGRLRDRGHLLRRRHGDLAVLPARHQLDAPRRSA